jgi:hypothetical protein
MSIYSFSNRSLKVGYRRIARTTDSRTFISTGIPSMPCGDAVFLMLSTHDWLWWLPAVTNSFAFDYATRVRLGGTNLNFFFASELPAVPPSKIAKTASLIQGIASLSLPNKIFATQWQSLKNGSNWKSQWALSARERLRLRCILDAAIAFMYGLVFDNFRHILRDCDYPERKFGDKSFTHKLDPKGFWRVDKEKPPHLRHTVLSLVAFYELERIGLDAFLNLNDGKGWIVPEKLRLADYGPGHDDRAREYQPVTSVLGPRFYDWQLAQSVEESWEECERHAELLAKIVPPPPKYEDKPQHETAAETDLHPPTDLFGNPIPTDLLGNPIYAGSGGKRR